MKNLPFRSKKAKSSIVRIGSEEVGFMYLLSRGGVTVNENPSDGETDAKNQAELTVTLLRAVKNCAKQEGITQAEARKKIFPDKKAKKDADLTDAPAIAPASDKLKSASGAIVVVDETKTVTTVVDEEPDLYDYLTPEEAGSLIKLNQGAYDRDSRIATNMIASRTAYTVIVAETCKSRSNLLSIQPLGFQIAVGNRFRRSNGEVVEVTQEALADSTELVVMPLTAQVEAEEVLYLMDLTGNIKIGDCEWTLEMTQSLLLESHIAMLVEFYETEESQQRGDQVASEVGNSTMKSTSSPPLSTPNQSTGVNSTGASKVTA